MKVGDLVKFKEWYPRKTDTPWFIDSAMDKSYEGFIGIIIEELPYNTEMLEEYGIPRDFFGKWFIITSKYKGVYIVFS